MLSLSFYYFKIVVLNQNKRWLVLRSCRDRLGVIVDTSFWQDWSWCIGEIDKKAPLTFQRPSRFSWVHSTDVWFPTNLCGEVGRKEHAFWRQAWVKTLNKILQFSVSIAMPWVKLRWQYWWAVSISVSCSLPPSFIHFLTVRLNYY